jgi:hypothetical protein
MEGTVNHAYAYAELYNAPEKEKAKALRELGAKDERVPSYKEFVGLITGKNYPYLKEINEILKLRKKGLINLLPEFVKRAEALEINPSKKNAEKWEKEVSKELGSEVLKAAHPDFEKVIQVSKEIKLEDRLNEAKTKDAKVVVIGVGLSDKDKTGLAMHRPKEVIFFPEGAFPYLTGDLQARLNKRLPVSDQLLVVTVVLNQKGDVAKEFQKAIDILKDYAATQKIDIAAIRRDSQGNIKPNIILPKGIDLKAWLEYNELKVYIEDNRSVLEQKGISKTVIDQVLSSKEGQIDWKDVPEADKKKILEVLENKGAVPLTLNDLNDIIKKLSLKEPAEEERGLEFLEALEVLKSPAKLGKFDIKLIRKETEKAKLIKDRDELRKTVTYSNAQIVGKAAYSETAKNILNFSQTMEQNPEKVSLIVREPVANHFLVQDLGRFLNIPIYEPPANLNGEQYFSKLMGGIKETHPDSLVIETRFNSQPGVALFYRTRENETFALKYEGEKINNIRWEGQVSNILNEGAVLLEFGKLEDFFKISPSRYSRMVEEAKALINYYREEVLKYNASKPTILVPAYGGLNYPSSHFIAEGKDSLGAIMELSAEELQKLRTPDYISGVRTDKLQTIEDSLKVGWEAHDIFREEKLFGNDFNNFKSFIYSMIKAESDFDIRAESPKGARGILQVMSKTWDSTVKKLLESKKINEGWDFDLAFDIEKNLKVGLAYFAEILEQIAKDNPQASSEEILQLSLASYNAGPNGKDVKEGRIPQNKETPAYVKKVMAYWKNGQLSPRDKFEISFLAQESDQIAQNQRRLGIIEARLKDFDLEIIKLNKEKVAAEYTNPQSIIEALKNRQIGKALELAWIRIKNIGSVSGLKIDLALRDRQYNEAIGTTLSYIGLKFDLTKDNIKRLMKGFGAEDFDVFIKKVGNSAEYVKTIEANINQQRGLKSDRLSPDKIKEIDVKIKGLEADKEGFKLVNEDYVRTVFAGRESVGFLASKIEWLRELLMPSLRENREKKEKHTKDIERLTMLNKILSLMERYNVTPEQINHQGARNLFNTYLSASAKYPEAKAKIGGEEISIQYNTQMSLGERQKNITAIINYQRYALAMLYTGKEDSANRNNRIAYQRLANGGGSEKNEELLKWQQKEVVVNRHLEILKQNIESNLAIILNLEDARQDITKAIKKERFKVSQKQEQDKQEDKELQDQKQYLRDKKQEKDLKRLEVSAKAKLHWGMVLAEAELKRLNAELERLNKALEHLNKESEEAKKKEAEKARTQQAIQSLNGLKVRLGSQDMRFAGTKENTTILDLIIAKPEKANQIRDLMKTARQNLGQKEKYVRALDHLTSNFIAEEEISKLNNEQKKLAQLKDAEERKLKEAEIPLRINLAGFKKDYHRLSYQEIFKVLLPRELAEKQRLENSIKQYEAKDSELNKAIERLNAHKAISEGSDKVVDLILKGDLENAKKELQVVLKIKYDFNMLNNEERGILRNLLIEQYELEIKKLCETYKPAISDKATNDMVEKIVERIVGITKGYVRNASLDQLVKLENNINRIMNGQNPFDQNDQKTQTIFKGVDEVLNKIKRLVDLANVYT